MSRFHTLTVADIRRETPDSVSVGFRVPPESAAAFAFRPGQYLTLRTTLDGQDARRSYSICAGLDDGELRIGVRRVPGGAMSTFVNDVLTAGDDIDVLPPQGRFGPDIDPGAARRYLGIAAGSGITPILSIAKSVLAREPGSTFTLVYGNRTSRSVMFSEAIEDLKDRHLGRFTVIHILSREAQEVPLLAGRIDADKLAALGRGIIDYAGVDMAFLCGPKEMMRVAKAALVDLGIESDNVKMELFSPGAPLARRPAAAVSPAEARVIARIEAKLDGKGIAFDLAESDESLITAAARQGFDLPHSCTGGMCSTCRCRRIEGEAEMVVNYALEPWELDRGFILACQARPKGVKLVLDFDQI